jgi:Tn3 transposase DDE domain
MGKIGSYARQNSLATALREMGRIEKTIFILDFLSSEALRRKIHRGLNKGAAMNAVARAATRPPPAGKCIELYHQNFLLLADSGLGKRG